MVDRARPCLISPPRLSTNDRQRLSLFYGALGENLTTRGLDPRQLRLGQILRAGGVRIELTKVRAPWRHARHLWPPIKQEIYDKRVKPATRPLRAGA